MLLSNSRHTVLCGALYTACVDASRTVFWDRSVALLGPAAVAGWASLGLAILGGLPTCAFRGTLAGGGVTAGGVTGVGVTCAGGTAGMAPPVCA